MTTRNGSVPSVTAGVRYTTVPAVCDDSLSTTMTIATSIKTGDVMAVTPALTLGVLPFIASNARSENDPVSPQALARLNYLACVFSS